MRYLTIDKLEKGMAIGQDIFGGTGEVRYKNHEILDEITIRELEAMGYQGIYVDDAFTQGIEIQEVISPEIRRETLKSVHEVFMTGNEPGTPEERNLQRTIEGVVDEILKNGDVMCNMVDIKSYEDYIYFHSINVAMISAMMGCRMGMSRERLQELTTCALLHDIGKRFIEDEILDAPRALSEAEREEMSQHSKLGYTYLKERFHFGEEILEGVLEHHEWYNGEGYPMRKASDEISLFGRIIKIADSYDAMVSKTPYHKPIVPSDAVEYIMAMAGVEFDPKLVIQFLDCVAVYPVGCEVVLSTGEHAIVVRNYRGFVLRPRVMLMESATTIDLKDDKDARCITIVELVA
ncbi:MAG: HD-GYP domain-containing protein [Agathobacter sp.]|nr:HD-GYP domain-containing protein [Agathobacter sp.]